MLQMKRYDIGAGLIGGLLTVLLFGISYAMEPRWMLHPLVYWGSTLFYLAAMLGACLLVNRENEGLLGIREGLRTGFVTFLIANCLFWGIQYLKINRLDHEQPQVQVAMMREYAEQQLMGQELRAQLDHLENQDFVLRWGDLFFGYARGAIGGFVLAGVLALAVKQDA